MASLSLLPAALTLSELFTPRKIDSSVGTEATSTDLFKKKVSLCCSSSVSLEHLLEGGSQKELFAKYLMALGTRHELESFEDLKRSYESIDAEELSASRIIGLSEGALGNGGSKREILSHFLGIWLRHMGYGTEKTKVYLQGRARLFLGAAALPSFSKIYQNLALLSMSPVERIDFMLQTCRNGWEYFVQQIGRRSLLRLSTDGSEKRRENALR